MSRVKIWLQVIFCFLKSFFGVKSNILCAEKTVEKLLEGKSLIRFGDGEFGIYRSKNIHYQQWSSALKERFEAIKSDFESDSKTCPYLLAVPKRFMQTNGFHLMKKRVYVASWAVSRYDFKKDFNPDLTYGDSFLFEKANKDIYKKIWESERCPGNVIFVHNSKVYAERFAETYGKTTFFVQCPAKNAFEQLELLKAGIEKVLRENGLTPNNCMLTVSAGPAGKCMVHDFSKQGFWCIDAGHCWDDPLEGI